MNSPIQHAILEYCANALWQIPLLAGTAWLALWVAQPAPRTQHRLWVAVLLLTALMPLHGIERVRTAALPEGIPDRPSPTIAMPPAPIEQANDRVGSTSDVESSSVGSEPAAGPSHATWLELLQRAWAGLHTRIVSLPIERVYAVWFVRLYVAVLGLGALRIVRGWIAAHRLVLRSQPLGLTRVQQEIWDRVSEEFAVRVPRLRQSEDVAGPVVVGIIEPTLLLPRGFAAYTEAQMRAALCHELAHVVRRDYATNLVCQVVTLPVVWHPVTHWVGRRVARTREMICDGMAASRMPSEVLYARALLALAQGMLTTRNTSQAHGLGLLGNHVLEERMENLMKMKSQVKARAIRTTVALGGMTAAVVVAGMFHVTPAFAQSVSQQIAPQPAPAATPASEAAPTPPPASFNVAIPRTANPPAAFAMEIPNQARGAASATGSSQSMGASGTPAKSSFVIAMPAPANGSEPVPAFVMGIPRAQDPNQPVAVAHGKDAMVSGSGHYHRWISPSGEPFVILNDSQAEPTEAEKRQIEQDAVAADAKTAKLVNSLSNLEVKQQILAAQKQVAQLQKELNSPEHQQKMKELQRQIAEAGNLRIDPARQAELARLNSPEFKKQMDDAQRQLALAVGQWNSPEYKQQMEDATRQLQEATRQLAEATRALKEAQAQLQEKNQK